MINLKNYSRQREAIINALCSTDTHPTAAWIYERVRQEIPNISLGTVYRNLSALSLSGDILSINVGDGFERFDGDILPHLHLHCSECKNIVDVSIPKDYFSDILGAMDFTPKTTVYVVSGICKNCKK